MAPKTKIKWILLLRVTNKSSIRICWMAKTMPTFLMIKGMIPRASKIMKTTKFNNWARIWISTKKSSCPTKRTRENNKTPMPLKINSISRKTTKVRPVTKMFNTNIKTNLFLNKESSVKHATVAVVAKNANRLAKTNRPILLLSTLVVPQMIICNNNTVLQALLMLMKID